MKRIGILGGTFDPIHNGHLAIAERAREQFHLEKVLFLPSGVPYMKDRQEVSPVEIRCEMTTLAIADTPCFELSKLEVGDAALGKNTYTFETLQNLRQIDPDAAYYFILGADNLYSIEKWKCLERIFQNCTILAAVRNDDEAPADPEHRTGGSIPNNSGLSPVRTLKSLERQAAYLREKYHARVELLNFSEINISSTQIREKLWHRESVSGLVPEAVEQYIIRHRIYARNA